jgi:hypothetical protein
MLLFFFVLFCCVRLGVLGKSVSFHYFFCCLGKSQAARPVSDRRLKTGSLPDNNRLVATIVLCLFQKNRLVATVVLCPPPTPPKKARGRQARLLPPDRTSKRPCDRGPWAPPKSETSSTNDEKNASADYSAGSQPSESHNTTQHAEHNNTKQPPLSSLLHFLQRPKTRSLAQKMCARSTLNRAYFGNTAIFY